MTEFDKIAEAEDYHVQAEFILHQLQANLEVYGSNSVLSGASPANVDLALQYNDRCLEYFPENPKYLNLRALLVGEGKGDKAGAITILKRAHALAPRDINIANNLKTFETSKCFIATAAYGTPFAEEISVLRKWRDTSLQASVLGRKVIFVYYKISPGIASFISRHEKLKWSVRCVLKPIVWMLRGK